MKYRIVVTTEKETSLTLPQKEKFSGCLIGQCLGDALGAPVEGHPMGVCEGYVDEILRTRRLDLLDQIDMPVGQYTDDSQLARELLQSYVEQKRFNPSDYASRIAAIFAEERIVGRGQATEQAAFRLIEGVPWEESGTPSPSAGNGSAMRAGPIGLMFFDDPELMMKAAHDQGRITHQDAQCSGGSVAIAGAVALALQPGTINTDDFVSQLVEWVSNYHQPFADYLLKLPEWLELSPPKAARLISKIGDNPDYPGQWRWISPYVVSSVLWSLYSFSQNP